MLRQVVDPLPLLRPWLRLSCPPVDTATNQAFTNPSFGLPPCMAGRSIGALAATQKMTMMGACPQPLNGRRLPVTAKAM
eukprot:11070843-Karenia_brevis.AAC.1